MIFDPSVGFDVDESILRDPNLLAKHIKKREKDMMRLSKELQFEDAAKVRDEVLQLKELLVS